MYRLSKSKLMPALQCPKRLYLEIHQPDLAKIDAGLQSRFATGHRVGEVARSLYPEGRLIGHDDDLGAALRETQAALAGEGDLLLFEPTFRHGGVLVRADLLFRKAGRYRLVEVKASTGIEDHHYQDAAIQAWVIDGAGYLIDAVSIAHVDNSFVYPGHGDYRGLLKFVDVTQDIEPLWPKVPEIVLRCQQILSGPLPDIQVGKQCGNPYACPFLAWCARDAPMRACMEALISVAGTDGPVFMYTEFERRVLREASARDAELASALDAIVGRLVDLHAIAKNHYYHLAQRGSWSLKSVLPTIAPDLDYANLDEVADGGGAQLACVEMIDPTTPTDRQGDLARALRIYCRRDTEGMARIASHLDRERPSESDQHR